MSLASATPSMFELHTLFDGDAGDNLVKNTNNSHYNDGRRAAKLLFEPLTRINSNFLAGSLFSRPMGLRVYGAGAVALGVIGLAWGDFALVWQPVPASVPGRTVLAYLTAAALL